MALSNAELLTAGVALITGAFGYGKLYQEVKELGRRWDRLEPILEKINASWIFQESQPQPNPLGEVDIHRMNRGARKRMTGINRG